MTPISKPAISRSRRRRAIAEPVLMKGGLPNSAKLEFKEMPGIGNPRSEIGERQSSSESTLEGRFLLHYSNPKHWRLRNVVEHPVDPGWEDAVYSDCHPKIRPLIPVGMWIVDVVPRPENDGSRKGVIRSVFQVTGKNSTSVLSFDSYYFADVEPIELPGAYIQYRAKTIASNEMASILSVIRSSYTNYLKGQRPRSIAPEDWSWIKQVRRDSLGMPHECN